VITAAVAARLLLAHPGPQDPTAPYWVAMSAASITVLAAAQILDMPGRRRLASARRAGSGRRFCQVPS